MKATLRGTEIYYDIAGMQLALVGNQLQERPIIFMLHGGPGGDHLRFKQHSLELQDVAQLVFIDHRGCGRSKQTKASDYTLENNIEDIEALRQHLGLDKVVLLGTSYGGMVAQGYATRYPKRVDKLILVVTAPSYRFLDEAKKYLATHGNAAQQAIARHLWNGSFRNTSHVNEFFKLMEPMYSVSARNRKKSAHSNKQPLTTWSHEALNKGFGGFLRTFDFIPKLKKITCPTLVLAGNDDWISRPNQSKIIATHIPQAKLHIFKNCGHSLAIDAHEKYIKTITRFLKRKPKTKG
jgi:proline iminopeptidase